MHHISWDQCNSFYTNACNLYPGYISTHADQNCELSGTLWYNITPQPQRWKWYEMLRVHHLVILFLVCRVPYQGNQLYPQGGYGQSSGGGPWSQYPYSQAYGQTAAAQVFISFTCIAQYL